MRDECDCTGTADQGACRKSVDVRVEVHQGGCGAASFANGRLDGWHDGWCCDDGCGLDDPPDELGEDVWDDEDEACEGDWAPDLEGDLAAELARRGIWLADDDEVALLAGREARMLFESTPRFTDQDRHIELGRIGEKVAQSYLSHRGFLILDTNWRCPYGEADIVAAEDDDLVFVEVKTRSAIAEGFPEEAVTPAKRARYERIASSYLLREGPEGSFRVRFDVIAILVLSQRCAFLRHHRDAFMAGGD